jgi:hypothetical protein
MASRPRKKSCRHIIRDGEKYNGPYRVNDDGSRLADFEEFDKLPPLLREYLRIKPSASTSIAMFYKTERQMKAALRAVRKSVKPI